MWWAGEADAVGRLLNSLSDKQPEAKMAVDEDGTGRAKVGVIDAW